MAYNLLKGIVEGSVDQYGDQEIDGIKVFKSTISASVFYDTDAQSPCATMKDVALTKIVGNRRGALLTYDSHHHAIANFDLVFDSSKKTLQTKRIVAESLTGSAGGLRDLPSDRFCGLLHADTLNFANGLCDVRGALQVKGGFGLLVSEDGVGINLYTNGGLSFRSKKLLIDPNNCAPINTDGQNLSDQDLLVVFDESRGFTYNTTLGNLYTSYIRSKMPLPSGRTGDIQFRTRGGFGSSANVCYDQKDNIFNIGGQLSTNVLKVGYTAEFQGAVVNNVSTVTKKVYEVEKDDYTILADTTKNSISITIPPACNHPGRILIIKKINKDKYKLNSKPVEIKVEEGTIDLSANFSLKYIYSARTIQSDGENWWIINKVGS